MPKKPLYKRIKYGNIFMLIIIIAFVVVMVSVIKSSMADDKPAEDSGAEVSSSAPSTDNSENTQADVQGGNGVLGKINYTYVKFGSDAVHNGLLLLISPDSQFSGSAPSDRVSCYDYMYDASRNKLFSIRNSEVEASVIVLDAVRKMMTEFYAVYGKAEMVLTKGYESGDRSDDLATGMSVMFRYRNGDGSYSEFNPIGSYQWIADNAYKYGLIMRYPSGKAEITGVSEKTGYMRYIGQPHAQIMYKNNMCLEEYIELVKKYSYDNAIAYTTEDGKNYAVYYCASEGSETNIKLPTDADGDLYKYEISGNNTDGYIITVHLPD